MTIKERYDRAIKVWDEEMPNPETELHYENTFQLIVAVILSAQCTDKRVNMITPALFEKFPTAEAMAKATPEEIYELIKSCSYPNNKTKSLLGMAKKLVDDFGGEVPKDLDDLLSLPGVGRKTANVILAVAFEVPAMAVDTHVFRVSDRIGLTRNCKNPLETEKALMRHLPTEIVPKAHHWLILHGRYVCKARKPLCKDCPLTDVCRHYPAVLKEEERIAKEKLKEKAEKEKAKAKERAKKEREREKAKAKKQKGKKDRLEEFLDAKADVAPTAEIVQEHQIPEVDNEENTVDVPVVDSSADHMEPDAE